MVRVRMFANVVSVAAVAVLLVASAAPANAACAAAWVCSNTYAIGAQVSFNLHNYTLQYGTRNASCPGYDPATDNWWLDNGTCTTGATPTYTATATATATTGGATPTFTATATATTEGAAQSNFQAAYWTQGNDPCIHNLPGGGGEEWIPMGSCTTCWAAWVSTTAYNGGAQVSKNCSAATPTATATGAATATATNTNTATPTSGGSGINSIVSTSQFDSIWPTASRSATYTYGDFVTAGGFYPGLCGTGDTNAKKRECAGYFASKDQETGVGQYDRELYCQPGGGGYGTTPCDYCGGSGDCGACATGQKYWGRHAVQLSWNFNYCLAQIQIPVTGLHADPNVIFSNKVTGWKASNWYWMTQLGPAVTNGYGTWPQETAHDATTTTDGSNNYGFAGTIRAVNGAIECQSRVQQQINRVTYYNGTGTDEEDSSGGTLGVLGYSGGTFGRRFCSP